MERLRMLLALGLLASALTMGPGCDDVPTGPDVVAAPSPTATPDPKTDPTSCVQTDAKIFGPTVGFVRDPFELRLIPFNEANVPLTSSCRYAQTVGWSAAGPCTQEGDRTSLTSTWFCIETGDLDIVATHGRFKALYRVRVVR